MLDQLPNCREQPETQGCPSAAPSAQVFGSTGVKRRMLA